MSSKSRAGRPDVHWGLAAPKPDGPAGYALCLTQTYLNFGATFSVSSLTEWITR